MDVKNRSYYISYETKIKQNSFSMCDLIEEIRLDIEQ